MSIHLQQECTAHKCSNDGCNWIGNKMQEAIHKIGTCLYQEENCQFCEIIISSGTREKHFQQDCDYLNEKEKCPYCSKFFVRKNINEHKHGLFRNKKTCLQLAIQKCDTDVTSMLLKCNINCQMALHWAAQNGYKHSAYFLFSKIS